MSTKGILDAHVLIWFLESNSRLSANCKAILHDPQNVFVLPATALAETLWLVERGHPTIASTAEFLTALDADPRIIIFSLNRAVLDIMLSLTAITEMHDRHIVATALLLAQQSETVALLTKDDNIRNSGLVA